MKWSCPALVMAAIIQETSEGYISRAHAERRAKEGHKGFKELKRTVVLTQ